MRRPLLQVHAPFWLSFFLLLWLSLLLLYLGLLAVLLAQQVGVHVGGGSLLDVFSARSLALVEEPAEHRGPYLVALRRESVPVKRRGKVVSFKTSYSGIVNVGQPVTQEFRVVFDTGSGHVILPSTECRTEGCASHRRYNMNLSGSAVPINLDGVPVPAGELCDRVTIGFGTGSVKGEFVREAVCLGPAVPARNETRAQPCVDAFTVMAVEMSAQPFKNFGFDGIIGLGLQTLSLSDDFSFFQVLSQGERSPLAEPRFGVFLTDGDRGDESEIAFGGHNPERITSPISWTKVSRPELGYWQVEIVAFRIGGRAMDICRDGDCRGILDTGTSHLGIPAPYDQEVTEQLSMPADTIMDCRLADLPTVEIEVPGLNITLYPENYMRRLPLREDVNIGSMDGIKEQPVNVSSAPAPPAVPEPWSPDPEAGTVQRHCRPRLMPVSLAPPLGPHLFILGEPVLHRYYTIFDWAVPQVGFAVSKNGQEASDQAQLTDRVGALPDDMEVFLMQQRLKTHGQREGSADDSDDDEVILIQTLIVVSTKSARSA